MRSLLPVLGLLCPAVVACQQTPPQSPPAGNIFSKGRKFIYQASHFAAGASQARLDTVAITCLGRYKPGQYDTTQTKIGYSYDATSPPSSFPGVLEKDSALWSHPPRDGQYRILELSPFPYIKLPARRGQRWTWKLAVGSQWGDAQWATWQGDMLVTSNYQTLGQQVIHTPLGALSCWVVQARATCSKGTSALTIFYHPRYGFVRWAYRNIDDSRLVLNLVAVTTVAASPTDFLPANFQSLGPAPQ
jgi:hypothetical protein